MAETDCEEWSCSDCGATRSSEADELAGEEYEKEINPVGDSRSAATITTVRCPECGSEEGWNSEAIRRVVGGIERSERGDER